VVAASEYKALQNQIRELLRLLGKKTLEAEILKEALEVATGPKKAVAQCLLEIVNEWSTQRQQHGALPVAFGIGLHYGTAFTGLLGTEERQGFTVIGDVVNTAQRIEELTKERGTTLLVSVQVLVAAGVLLSDANWMPLPPKSLRGRSEPVWLFELSSSVRHQPRNTMETAPAPERDCYGCCPIEGLKLALLRHKRWSASTLKCRRSLERLKRETLTWS
jgi:hypothetical protein